MCTALLRSRKRVRRERWPVGRDQGVFDHCCAVDESEQVPKGVGAPLAVTSAVNHVLPFRADGAIGATRAVFPPPVPAPTLNIPKKVGIERYRSKR